MRIRAVALLVAVFLTASLSPDLASGARAGHITTAADPFTIAAPAGQGRNAVAKDRYIVVLKNGTDAKQTADRFVRRDGVAVDRLYGKALRGFSARLDAAQRAALAADPSVAEIVPDEVIALTGQTVPTGVSRVGVTRSETAAVDGTDQRVDADVAIVDTGIDPRHPDLNVVGGRNCTSSSTGAWGDVEGHGTHVAGTVGAIDNGTGVVGVAPGVRLWSVRILGSDGNGLLSWYICGLDWIAAQRDPNDPSRPLFEAVNMSVTKWGSDDGNCGLTNKDVLHQAICRLVDSGVTVVAAAANDSGPASRRVPASYDEVITVSALADTDGKPGGLGGHRCYSWGTYDVDDTFADFSNYGSDVDLIAPGKCILSTLRGGKYGYSSGTSMAAPHVTGAVALYKATRPWATPREVREALMALATYDWRTGSDPDGHPDRLLSVDHIGPYGDFAVGFASSDPITVPAGGRAQALVTVERTETMVERVRLAATASADMTLTFSPASLLGLTATQSTLTVEVPPTTAPGTYTLTLTGTEHGRVREAATTVTVTSSPGRETSLTRLAGRDRFATTAAVSAATFAPGVDVVYVASAWSFPDALAGAAAAGTVKGPVLLAAPTGPLHPATIAELVRLKPARIVVLGGTAVVSDAVADRLAGYLVN